MLIRKSFSVQQRMTGIIFLVSLFVLVLTSALFVFIEFQRIHAEAREDLTALSHLIATNVGFSLAIRDFRASEDVLDSLEARKDIVSAYLLLPNGNAIVAYFRAKNRTSRVDTQEDVQMLHLEAQQFEEGLRQNSEVLWETGDYITHFMPIVYEGTAVGYLYMRSEPVDMYRQKLYLILGWLLIMGTSMVVTYLLSLRLQRHITAPVHQLAEQMEKISREKNLAGFEPKSGQDEFKLLFQGFDEMMLALRERDKMLERHRRTLENEVKIRTSELEEAKEAAEHATESKSRFLANMSHEIRTPMIGVLGMADLLRKKELVAEDKQLAETIYRSGEALLAVLNDILDFSKIEAGRLEIEKVPFSLQRIAEDVTQLMEVNAVEKGIRLSLCLADELPPLLGDPGRIRQVMLNLVGNAVKFTETGEVSMIVDATSEKSAEILQCKLIVRDTGIGIPAEVKRRVFRSFDQGDGSTTRKFGGTGLGLAITHELVTMMGGTITVDSVVGEGSEFTVSLPLQIAPEQVVQPESAELGMENPAGADRVAAHGRLFDAGYKVLVAEDNPTTQELLSILLRNMGVTLTIVSDGVAAVEALRIHDVDLVFMDCQMPLLDGLEATAIIRAEGIKTPIVALTAYARHEDEERCLEAGMDDFLCKPFRQSELKVILDKWLGRDSVRRQSDHDQVSSGAS